MDLRLGRRATFPFDDMGPLGVNLVNGNLVAAVGGPSFGTVSPPVGIGLAYNSQTPVLHGLTGDYHRDADSDGVLEGTDPRLVRRIDRQVNFNWAGGSPQPAVLPADRFIATWSGSIRVPAGQAGNDWVLVTTMSSGDSVAVDVNGNPVLSTSSTTGVSSQVSLSEAPTLIRVTFAEATGHLRRRRSDENGDRRGRSGHHLRVGRRRPAGRQRRSGRPEGHDGPRRSRQRGYQPGAGTRDLVRWPAARQCPRGRRANVDHDVRRRADGAGRKLVRQQRPPRLARRTHAAAQRGQLGCGCTGGGAACRRVLRPRATGGIAVPTGGVDVLSLADGLRGRVYIDDDLVFDSWDGTADAAVTAAVTEGEHKLTVEYRHISGDATFELQWTPTGQTTAVAVPGGSLTPRLGLVTRSTDPDGHVVATAYDDPLTGRPTATTVDPDGLALTETSTYEMAGTGKYARLTSVTLPATGHRAEPSRRDGQRSQRGTHGRPNSVARTV